MKKHELFSDELKQFINDQYVKLYSVTKVISLVNDNFACKIGRGPITKHLKSVGLYEGLSGPNYIKKKVENQVECLQSKYGVSNWGQMADAGYKKQNKIPYRRLKLLDDLFKYKEDVDKMSKKNVNKKKGDKLIPAFCEYTGIEFADNRGEVNPNDPRKRTVDHVTPVTQCFLLGWSVEKASDLNNLKFVIRFVNSMKSNTSLEDFERFIPMIKEAFANESY